MQYKLRFCKCYKIVRGCEYWETDSFDKYLKYYKDRLKNVDILDFMFLGFLTTLYIKVPNL